MKKRSLVLMVIFTIFTLGIYAIYWYVAFQSDLKRKTKEGFGGFAHLIVTIITFGLYYFYWQYAAGKRLAKKGADDLAIIYLLLGIFGFGWLNALIMQSQANGLK